MTSKVLARLSRYWLLWGLELVRPTQPKRASEMKKQSNGAGKSPAITQHAWARMSGRSLNLQTIDKVLNYGRVVHVRGAAIHVIGKKEVDKLARSGVDVGGCEGVQVVCTPDGSAILTAYRNSDFRGLKPRGAKRWH